MFACCFLPATEPSEEAVDRDGQQPDKPQCTQQQQQCNVKRKGNYISAQHGGKELLDVAQSPTKEGLAASPMLCELQQTSTVPAFMGGEEHNLDCAERRKWGQHLVPKEQLHSWSFSAFEFGLLTQGNPLIVMTLSLLDHYDLLDGWRVNRKTVEKFLATVESEYLPNAYHNNIHATDVTQTSAIILESCSKHVSVSKMDIFCIIIASAVHDLGHLGVNNDFLINSRHPRATTYNDRSVNESYHISRAFEITRTMAGCDIFEQFSFDEQKKCRKLMVDMVMATDMAIHFDLLKKFSTQAEEMPDLSSWPDPSLLFQMLLHLADIANPSRPFHLARGWAERVIQEFCEQGDKEEAGGLPLSPFCMRSTMDMPKAQLNFIEVFLRPTLLAYEKAAPDFVGMALKSLDVTVSEWKALQEQGFKMVVAPFPVEDCTELWVTGSEPSVR